MLCVTKRNSWSLRQKPRSGQPTASTDCSHGNHTKRPDFKPRYSRRNIPTCTTNFEKLPTFVISTSGVAKRKIARRNNESFDPPPIHPASPPAPPPHRLQIRARPGPPSRRRNPPLLLLPLLLIGCQAAGPCRGP